MFRRNQHNNFPCCRVIARVGRPILPGADADRRGKVNLLDAESKTFEKSFSQPVEELVIRNVGGELAFLAVEKKKINIRAVIQLATAEFSERENRKFRRWRSLALSHVGVPVFEHPTDANLGDL